MVPAAACLVFMTWETYPADAMALPPQSPRDAEAVLGDPALAGVSLRLRQLARPAVRLISAAVSGDDAIPLGASKLGGLPDLPPGTPWPRKGPPVEGPLPIPFLCQVRLDEVAPYGLDGVLPAHGLLSFFYDDACADASRHAYVDNYGHPAHCRVLWSPGETFQDNPLVRATPPPDLFDPAITVESLTPIGPPAPRDVVYAPLALTPSAEVSLPNPESELLLGPGDEPVFMSRDEWEAYTDLWEAHMDHNNRVHQLLGHAAPNQAAAVWSGHAHARRAFFGSEADTPGHPPYPEFWFGELRRHRLLLQVSAEDNRMWFGREGRLCLLIHEDDLAARDFSRVWFAA